VAFRLRTRVVSLLTGSGGPTCSDRRPFSGHIAPRRLGLPLTREQVIERYGRSATGHVRSIPSDWYDAFAATEPRSIGVGRYPLPAPMGKTLARGSTTWAKISRDVAESGGWNVRTTLESPRQRLSRAADRTPRSHGAG